jgi:hypothetical protein
MPSIAKTTKLAKMRMATTGPRRTKMCEMTVHRTATGHVQLLYQWTDDRMRPHYAHPNLITDDDDGHYQQWEFTGEIRDAAAVLGRLLIGTKPKIAVFSRRGRTVRVTDAPDDFWLDRDTGLPPVDDGFVQLIPNTLTWWHGANTVSVESTTGA